MCQQNHNLPDIMKAVAIDRFGGPEELKLQTLPTPDIGPDEVLIRVNTAGVGVWDPMDRKGFFAEMYGSEPDFPYILGGEGAGTVASAGKHVTLFKKGDRVYAYGAENPKVTFYAEYAAVPADDVMPVPDGLSLKEAGAMPADAVTALCGLDQVLDLKANKTVLIFGASGGLGHLTVQFARRMGARVFAVASGEDGVELVQELGADLTINGYEENIVEAAQQFAPDGFDTALLTAGGDAAEQAVSTVREGGGVAYPNGVQPMPEGRSGISIKAYNGRATPDLFSKLNNLFEQDPFRVNVAQSFPLEKAAEAHRSLDEHYLGKLALKVGDAN